MSKKDNELKKYKLLQTLDFNSRSGNKRNCVKCWKNVSYEHFRVMSDIVWKLVNQGYEVYTECNIKGCRIDVAAISPTGQGYAIEIMKSEPESSYNEKLDKYDINWVMVKVNTKDFCIDTWEL